MKIKYLVSCVIAIIFFLLEGCSEPPTTVPLGSSITTWGNKISIYDAQRYEEQYTCGDYICYQEYIMVLIEWECEEHNQSNRCVLGGYEFSLKDMDSGRTSEMSIYVDPDLFTVPIESFGCCGWSTAGNKSINYMIFPTACGDDYQLRLSSDNDGVYYFKLPSNIDCGH